MIDSKMNPLTPLLRFQDFSDEWNIVELKKISKKIWIGLVTTMTKNYTSSGVRLIRNSNIRTNKIVDEDPIFLDESFAGNFKSRSFKKGDITTVHTGDVGTSAIIDDEYDGAQGFATLNTRVKDELVKNIYLCSFLNTSKYKKWAVRYSTGDGRNNLNLNDFVKSKIPITSLEEQQKISSFLSSVDKWIENLEKQKKSLEEYKKGMMQKIFSREIRFKDDDENKYSKWKKYKFTDLYEFGVTNSFTRDKLNNLNIGIFNIHYGDIHTKFSSHFELAKEDVPTIESSIDALGKLDKVSVGDIVIADASEDYKDIGKTIEIVSTNEKEVVAGLHTILGKNKKTFETIGFISYLMQSYKQRLKLMKIAQGAKVLGLSKKYLKDVVFEMPCDEEQQKIALFLSSIDKLVASKETQIEKAKEWKKGLLQQMFV